MKHRRPLRLACAACLLLCIGSFAYHAAAATFLDLSDQQHPTKAPHARPCMMLRGRQLVTFAGYELNATFTPDGKFYCFDINKQ